MLLALANLAQALLLTVRLFLPVGDMPAAAAPHAAGLPRPGPPNAALPAEALLPDGAGSIGPCAGVVDDGPDVRAAGNAAPISERRARAVAMTVFSLGTVVGAGFLAVFLIKRLL